MTDLIKHCKRTNFFVHLETAVSSGHVGEVSGNVK